MADRIVAFMPLKRESRRVPGKNLKRLGDRPLCQWMGGTIRELLVDRLIDDAFLFATDEDLQRLVPTCKFLPITPDPLSSAISKVCEFVTRVEADIYVELFATSPFLSAASIAACINAVRSGEFRSATTVERRQGYWWVGGEANYLTNAVPATDTIRPLLIETTGCYVFRREVALSERRLDPTSCRFVEVEWPEWVDIDTPADWAMAEAVSEGKSHDAHRGNP